VTKYIFIFDQVESGGLVVGILIPQCGQKTFPSWISFKQTGQVSILCKLYTPPIQAIFSKVWYYDPCD